jgi:ribosomal protection tetracycline resistance protein
VTMTDCGYRAPGTTAADFHRITPLVLMAALHQEGTQVCEPMVSVTLEVPTDAVSRILPFFARLGARVQAPMPRGNTFTVEAVLQAALVHELQRSLPALTGGEGALETRFAGYESVAERPRRVDGRSRPIDS